MTIPKAADVTPGDSTSLQSGMDGSLYERHLFFDNVTDLADAGARDRFEAFARSVRDVLSRRWALTQSTYERHNPKRVYYLSMEFLIGRSLANNVTNLLLDSVVQEAVRQENLNWIELLEQEPDAGLGNGGLGRLAACFLDSLATMQYPAMGYGLRYEYGLFKQDHPGRLAAGEAGQLAAASGSVGGRSPAGQVEVKLNCSFEARAGALCAIPGPSEQLDRHSLRSARGGLRRQDGEYAAPVGGGGARLLRLSSFQPWRVRRRRG